VPQIVHTANSQVLVFQTFGAEKGPGTFTISGPDELVKAVGKDVAQCLKGRGGGRAGRFQGQAELIENRTKAIELMTQILEAISRD
jgi:alanyl-tRNA synthetase